MDNQFSETYERLQIKGKIGELLRRMQTYRSNISRNTIRLAFADGATTPLRAKILKEADELLQEETGSTDKSVGAAL